MSDTSNNLLDVSPLYCRMSSTSAVGGRMSYCYGEQVDALKELLSDPLPGHFRSKVGRDLQCAVAEV